MTVSDPLQDSQDKAIKAILDIYTSLLFKPPPKQFTVLAAFYLTRRCDALSSQWPLKVISISTGTKCTPAIKYSPRGELVHDSHAEVLARRGALRWLLEEIGRINTSTGYVSEWLTRIDGSPTQNSDERPPYLLRRDVELNMYVSTLPCGDASMRYLASTQDATMAALKSTNVFPLLAPHEASRGRDNYNRLGVLRTKPGRADSPPALSMSCSDKMAKWSVVGVQGSFGSRFLEPVYIRRVIIGEVPRDDEGMRRIVREDCERALKERLGDVKGLPEGYAIHPPEICFTDIPFVHCKTELDGVVRTTGSCNESLCWVADSKPSEVLINGLKRSTSPKNRYSEKYRPMLSRISMFDLYRQIMELEGLVPIPYDMYYVDAKAGSMRYQRAKTALLGPEGLFSGWIRIDTQYQRFTLNE
ncbi:adenosine deaminase/editase [Macrolepiota fuliginosa MF-IS2]|uniref:Adenosine deaminase/editase n=1 Tax=Macrolepiota fuliginosa MF-IS2 TaxID=1400762 RepID=A0A9P5XIF5_9AGAR|nr:adenosine deaminase/editase [Macrolepiota fuliginosa MF-IS2]